MRTAVAGLMLLGLAVALATFVVVRFLFGGPLGLALGGGVALLAFGLWIVVPMVDRRRSGGKAEVARR